MSEKKHWAVGMEARWEKIRDEAIEKVLEEEGHWALTHDGNLVWVPKKVVLQ